MTSSQQMDSQGTVQAIQKTELASAATLASCATTLHDHDSESGAGSFGDELIRLFHLSSEEVSKLSFATQQADTHGN